MSLNSTILRFVPNQHPSEEGCGGNETTRQHRLVPPDAEEVVPEEQAGPGGDDGEAQNLFRLLQNHELTGSGRAFSVLLTGQKEGVDGQNGGVGQVSQEQGAGPTCRRREDVMGRQILEVLTAAEGEVETGDG